ncbi:MAG: ABC transporter permease [Thermoanaerobaculia bacterium]|nr:ABC transporter permease [Thermoanaerobaculia bacterium]
MDAILNFRYAFRKLLKSPGSSLVAVVAMALGIALTATMFSIIDGIYLKGLPFEDPGGLVHLEQNNLEQGWDSIEVGVHNFEDWRRQQTSFEGMAGFTMGTFNLADGDNLPERFNGAWISPDFLDLLRVEPVLGRGFEPTDKSPEAPKVLLLSHKVWSQRYGSDESIVGRQVRVNAEPVEVIGVLPDGFEFPIEEELWMPLVLETGEVARGEGRTLEVVARLKDGVEIDEAQTEMSLIAGRLAEAYPEENEGVGAIVQPYLDEYIGETTRMILGVMMTAVLLVLLMACFNVANLLMGRATRRSRELAIRTALGSSRWHAVRQVLWESAAIALVGAVLGCALAYYATGAFAVAIENDNPGFWVDIEFGLRGLFVALAATLLASGVAGLLPALQATRSNVTEALQDAGRGSTSFRMGWVGKTLVISQVAVSAALLVGAAMTVRSIVQANSYDLQFETDNLLVARLGLFEEAYPDDASRVAFYEDLTRRLEQRPEVAGVSLGTVVPTDTAIGAGGGNYERPGEEYEKVWQMPWSRRVLVTPGYFDSLEVPIMAGRDFTAFDRAKAPAVALVNQGFATREWGDENPIGKSIDLWMGEEAEAEDPNAGVVEVVGLVSDLRFADFDDADDQHGVYLPIAQQTPRFTWIVVKTKGEPNSFGDTLRREVLALDPDLPLYYVRSMNQVLSETLFIPNLIAVMFGIFGVVALVLACVGLFGLMSFAVAQRTQEMGVRMALGASAGEVLRMVLGQGLKQTCFGLAAGLVLGLGLSKLLSSILFRVGFGDLVTFVTVPVILLTVAIAATLWPAIRASSVDPMVALRYE